MLEDRISLIIKRDEQLEPPSGLGDEMQVKNGLHKHMYQHVPLP